MCNFDAQRMERLLEALKSWSGRDARVRGMALVGSWSADDRRHAESDADIVLVVDDPEPFRSGSSWMDEIDWHAAGLGPGHWTECDYGRACSRHLKFDGGAEIEVSFVAPGWAAVDPVDPSTRRVAGNGMRVLHDPDGLLGRLLTVL
ncbi:MAG: aminoglycoside 6-adenylyltransferase [Hyphomicrobiaceae bacterium]